MGQPEDCAWRELLRVGNLWEKRSLYQKRSFRNPLVSLGTFTVKSPTVFQPSGVQVLRLLLEASLDLKVALVMSGFQTLSSE